MYYKIFFAILVIMQTSGSSLVDVEVDSGGSKVSINEDAVAELAEESHGHGVSIMTNVINIKSEGCCRNGEERHRETTIYASTTLTTAPSRKKVPWIMVVGGQNHTHSLTEVEFVSLDPWRHPVPECIKQRAERYPESQLKDGVGGAIKDGSLPLVCGRGYHYQASRECYAFDAEANRWAYRGDMRYYHQGGAASVHPDRGLIISLGGTTYGDAPQLHVESTQDGESFSASYPKVPSPATHPCQVLADENTLMLFGDVDYAVNANKSSKALAAKLDLTTMEWSDLSDVGQNLTGAVCGLVTNETAGGTRHVVVATAEHKSAHKSTPNRVNILDLDTMTWRRGNPFPNEVSNAKSVQIDDATFALVGGIDKRDPSRYLDSVYLYNAGTDTWTRLPEGLTQPKHSVTAFYVDRAPFPDCF